MADCWSFYGFDWAQYRVWEVPLRQVRETGDFSGLETAYPDSADILSEVLEAFDESDPAEAVCNALLGSLCLLDEPVVFEKGLPELILRFRRHPHHNGEEIADLLGELISARKNVADWFDATPYVIPGGTLVGLLTVAETEALAARLTTCMPTLPPPTRLRGLALLTQRFTPGEVPQSRLDDLLERITAAARDGEGLAVLYEAI